MLLDMLLALIAIIGVGAAFNIIATLVTKK
jgi:hypothetical protein